MTHAHWRSHSTDKFVLVLSFFFQAGRNVRGPFEGNRKKKEVQGFGEELVGHTYVVTSLEISSHFFIATHHTQIIKCPSLVSQHSLPYRKQLVNDSQSSNSEVINGGNNHLCG